VSHLPNSEDRARRLVHAWFYEDPADFDVLVAQLREEVERLKREAEDDAK
jgi:hypothetical protein